MMSLFVRYAVVSMAGTLTYVLLFALFIAGPLNAVYASVLAFIPALAVQFALNYSWTFRSNARRLPAFGKFSLVSLSGLGINILVMHAGVNVAGMRPSYVLILALLAVTVNNYTLNRLWSFRAAG